MIKTGIIGAEGLDAGELSRILINHPEVDIKVMFSPDNNGRQVSSIHHGFIGEEIVNFSNTINPEELDVVFIMDDSIYGRTLIENRQNYPELRIINLSPGRFARWDSFDMEYGLSEYNRKALVRGAKYAIIPSQAASLALIALSPLARYLLLNDDIRIEIAAPQEVANNINKTMVAEEIARQLKNLQSSFNAGIEISVNPNKSRRVMRIKFLIPCQLSFEEITRIYENTYDDHNFIFIHPSEIEGREIEGTHKCIISYQKKNPETLQVEIVGDCRLRGGAGDAVHVMNLFFSLYEKTGLNLKPSRYGASQESTSRSVSWFA